MKKVDINESRVAQFFLVTFFILLFTIVPVVMIGTYFDTSKLFNFLMVVGLGSMIVIGSVLMFTVK